MPRITVGTDYALSTLCAIFPKSLVDNIAFVFTNVSSALSWNFSMDTIPDVLNHADMFFLDNPIALQKKYLNFKDDLDKQKLMTHMRRAILDSEEQALEMLVDLFDRLDGLGTQPTTEIVYLYHLSQSIETMITNTLAQKDQAATKKVEIDKLIDTLKNNPNVSISPYYCLGFNFMLVWHRLRMFSRSGPTSTTPSQCPSGGSSRHSPST